MSFKGLTKFFRKKYRDVFGTSLTGTTSSQIHAMRERRRWSQERLAQEAGMGQARISLLENPNYQSLSLNTLKRIANVFDVALIVRFVPFSKLFELLDNESQQTLAIPSFEDEFGTEANPITTPNEKIIDLSQRLRAMYLESKQGTALKLGACEAQQAVGANSEAITEMDRAARVFPVGTDRYEQRALREGHKSGVGKNDR